MLVPDHSGRIITEERSSRALPAEIAFLERHGVSQELLGRAAALAASCGVAADEALLRAGLLSEERFFRALAAETGLPFLDGPLRVHPRAVFPQAALAGLAPLGDGATDRFAYGPRGEGIARLLASAGRVSDGLALATPAAIRDGVVAARATSVALAAADGLARKAPDLSYRDGADARQRLVAMLIGFVTGCCASLAPDETGVALSFAFGIAFLGNTAIRLAAVLENIPPVPVRRPPPIADRELPVYTVLVALHREDRVVPKLVRALEALDYPAPKLDVKILIETNDRETAEALAGLRLPGFVEVITVPPGEPRTKPRALNVGLALARGEFLVIYDAEDVPDPGQLRLAVSTFRRSEPDLACLQARLVIDNSADGLLTRFFAVEYATLFDVTNPALVCFDLPVPLGGTSNHLRTAVLRELGGWDAWNVTEDADLGLRLAAAGFRVGDLPSATLEEAPRHAGSWLRQRTRWMKGFLQVSVVHSRRPLRNLRRLGPVRMFGAAAVTAGTVASALAYPFLVVLAIDAVVTGRLFRPEGPVGVALSALGLTLFAAGLLALTIPPLEALRRRRWWSLMPLVALMPAYYGLVSLAAWCAVAEFLFHPERWNKTEHGLARTSRHTPPGGPTPEVTGAAGL